MQESEEGAVFLAWLAIYPGLSGDRVPFRTAVILNGVLTGIRDLKRQTNVDIN
jgi:hypothetical protein